jgi:hypothetical protein
MLVDNKIHILRAQCKTGRFINGCVEFATSSKNGFTGVRTAYKDQIDIFLIYAPKINKIYIFPANQATPTYTTIRVDPAKGGSKSNIRWAKKFEI